MKIAHINIYKPANFSNINRYRLNHTNSIPFGNKNPSTHRKSEIAKLNVDKDVLKLAIEFSDIQYKKFIQVLKRNTKSSEAYEASFREDKEFNRLIFLLDKNVSYYRAKDICEFKDKEYEKFLKLYENGFNEFDALMLAYKDDEVYNSFFEYLSQGYSPYMIDKYVGHYNKDNINKLKALTNLGLSIEDADKITLDENKFQKELDKIKKEDEKISEVTREIDEKNLKILKAKDRRFLAKNAFDNEFYSPKDYIRNFLYFKSLVSKNNKRILSAQYFADGMNKYGFDMGNKDYENDVFYNNVKIILNTSPYSVDSSYLEMFLDLIQNGKLNPLAIRKIETKNNKGANISTNLKKDIDKYYSAYLNGLDVKDDFIPTYKNNKEAIKQVEEGECFQLENEKFIRIKINNKSKKLHITKDKYFELFPPIKRFSTSQFLLGDCYCIETLMAMFNNPKGRYMLLDMLNEDDYGNITINTMFNEDVFFKDGKLLKEEEIYYSNGAYGYKLFEYAYGIFKTKSTLKKFKSKLDKSQQIEFEDYLKQHKNDVYVYYDNGKINWTTYKNAVKTKMYLNRNDDVNRIDKKQAFESYNTYLLGNGGLPNLVLDSFGIKNDIYVVDDEFGDMSIESLLRLGVLKKIKYLDEGLKQKLATKEFFDKNVVLFEMDCHEYGINAVENNGKIAYEIFNPHSQATPSISYSLDDIIGNMKFMTIISVD